MKLLVFQSTKDILKKHSFNLDTARKISNMDEDNEDFLLKNTLEMKPKKDVESESEIIRKRIQSEELIKDNNKQITNNEKDETQDLKKQKKQKKFYHLMDKIYETFSEFNTPNKSRTDSIVYFFFLKQINNFFFIFRTLSMRKLKMIQLSNQLIIRILINICIFHRFCFLI